MTSAAVTGDRGYIPSLEFCVEEAEKSFDKSISFLATEAFILLGASFIITIPVGAALLAFATPLSAFCSLAIAALAAAVHVAALHLLAAHTFCACIHEKSGSVDYVLFALALREYLWIVQPVSASSGKIAKKLVKIVSGQSPDRMFTPFLKVWNAASAATTFSQNSFSDQIAEHVAKQFSTEQIRTVCQSCRLHPSYFLSFSKAFAYFAVDGRVFAAVKEELEKYEEEFLLQFARKYTFSPKTLLLFPHEAIKSWIKDDAACQNVFTKAFWQQFEEGVSEELQKRFVPLFQVLSKKKIQKALSSLDKGQNGILKQSVADKIKMLAPDKFSAEGKMSGGRNTLSQIRRLTNAFTKTD